jgi:hypothetical protein
MRNERYETEIAYSRWMAIRPQSRAFPECLLDVMRAHKLSVDQLCECALRLNAEDLANGKPEALPNSV